MSEPSIQELVDPANFTAGKMAAVEAEKERKEAEENAGMKEEAKKERREERASRLIERTNQAFVKVAVKDAMEKRKEEAKVAQDIEDARKKDLLYKINLYLTRFPFLSEKIPKVNARSSMPELVVTLGLIREEMNSQRSLYQVQSYAGYGFLMVDQLWGDGKKMTFVPEPLRLNLSGIYSIYRSGALSEDILPLLMEIDIEYPWLGRQSLVMRSLEALSGILLKVHAYNTNPSAKKLFNLSQEKPSGVDVSDL
jgi:hypothetical protein